MLCLCCPSFWGWSAFIFPQKCLSASRLFSDRLFVWTWLSLLGYNQLLLSAHCLFLLPSGSLSWARSCQESVWDHSFVPMSGFQTRRWRAHVAPRVHSVSHTVGFSARMSELLNSPPSPSWTEIILFLPERWWKSFYWAIWRCWNRISYCVQWRWTSVWLQRAAVSFLWSTSGLLPVPKQRYVNYVQIFCRINLCHINCIDEGVYVDIPMKQHII